MMEAVKDTVEGDMIDDLVIIAQGEGYVAPGIADAVGVVVGDLDRASRKEDHRAFVCAKFVDILVLEPR